MLLNREEEIKLARWVHKHRKPSFLEEADLYDHAIILPNMEVTCDSFQDELIYITLFQKERYHTWWTKLLGLKPRERYLQHRIRHDEDGPWWDDLRCRLKMYLDLDNHNELMKRDNRQNELNKLRSDYYSNRKEEL